MNEHEEALFEQQYNDLRLLVMAALAFNMGFRAKDERTPASVRAIDEACRRLGFLCGFNIKELDVSDM